MQISRREDLVRIISGSMLQIIRKYGIPIESTMTLAEAEAEYGDCR